MTSYLILIASLNFLMGKSMCGPILEIVETNNDVKTMLSTKLVTRSNTNVSLTCRIVDSDNKMFFDNHVIWFKRRKGLGHHKSEIVGEGNLTFNPIKMTDSGRYVCKNFNYSLYKAISIIIVHPSSFSKKKMSKRAAVKSDIPSPNTLMYAESTMETIPIQLSTKQELYHQSYKTRTLHENELTYKPVPIIKYFVKILLSSLLTIGQCDEHETNNENNDKYNNTADNIEPTALEFAILTVCVIMIYIMKDCKARMRNTNNGTSQCNTSNSNNFNNQQNGIGVSPITRTYGTDNSIALTTLSIGDNNSLEYLDLPPTYADSTRNTPINSSPSSCRSSLEDVNVNTADGDAGLPPTYDEAIANLKSTNANVSNDTN